jgi:hypothetical protein
MVADSRFSQVDAFNRVIGRAALKPVTNWSIGKRWLHAKFFQTSALRYSSEATSVLADDKEVRGSHLFSETRSPRYKTRFEEEIIRAHPYKLRLLDVKLRGDRIAFGPTGEWRDQCDECLFRCFSFQPGLSVW